jgi:transcriptional regulator PpsR
MTTGGAGFWASGAVPLIEPENLSSILSAASDIALVVDKDGVILSLVVNENNDGFGNLNHWEGRPVVDFLSVETVEKFQRAHSAHLEGVTISKPVELNHEDNAAWQYPVRYTFHSFGQHGTVLMLGRDLRPIAESQQQLVQAQIALEQGYEARREFDARYRMVLQRTREAVLFVSVQDGRISDCSDPAAVLLGMKRETLIGTPFAQLLTDRSPSEFMEALMNASLAEGGGTVEVRAERTDHALVIEPTVFRAGGQRVLHCTLLTSGSNPKVADVEAGQAVALVCSASEAIVFTDADGLVMSANDGFLDLVGAAHGNDVTGRSMSDYLTRGQVDLGVLIENARRTGHMRIYATKIANELGSKVSVEVSATYLADPNLPSMAFVIRDVSRVEGVRSPGSPSMPEDSRRNVMELVGSASLKDIVAETTDVVEKMCIETAVILTQNNRVAQSLASTQCVSHS